MSLYLSARTASPGVLLSTFSGTRRGFPPFGGDFFDSSGAAAVLEYSVYRLAQNSIHSTRFAGLPASFASLKCCADTSALIHPTVSRPEYLVSDSHLIGKRGPFKRFGISRNRAGSIFLFLFSFLL